MKRCFHILLVALALTLGVSAYAQPEWVTQQRIEAPTTSGANAVGSIGRINLTAGGEDATFSIYSITGQLVRTVRLTADGHATVDLPKGFYIVKYNDKWSKKVIVK